VIDVTKTYCNPIPLPEYPIGRDCLRPDLHHRCDYRETADPTVLWEDGKWYLYPSCGMVYWTEDFVTWHHVRMEPYDCGYAPTVVKHRGRFYLTASGAPLYVADSPLGPFQQRGWFRLPNGDGYSCGDPMLFSDDDGRLYLYSGCGGGIRGVELDADDPLQLLTEPLVMFDMDTVNHPWERIGDWNADGSYSWTEGAWMHKHGDTYYLTYSAPGTQWSTYAMGAYKSHTPLGPWEYMESSPFLTRRYGIVRATGHGCVVEGPRDTLWVFYTCLVGYGGDFERRCGFDALGFDEHGDIVAAPSEIPQWIPGYKDDPHRGNDAGLLPLTQHGAVGASSAVSGRDALYACDDSLLTWWQPKADDPDPTLTVHLSGKDLMIASMRLMWRDVGLDAKGGVMPGAFQYRVEARSPEGEWVCVLDRTDNRTDMLIDYQPLIPMYATAVRLRVTGHPEGIEPGVMNFTVFGQWVPQN